ncbi:hypothetical protein CI109_106127 [Kwoniella shandongensis]|uniref:Uncharacterized protein n=1 Tax=Kwoniella shandongensis TaxID=1734106 RepID=A0A5M6C193_9TREE|nr:uncharacterized protein CI109_003733 [Kwoniella shandongensis]KAA5527762.1 hypothetical protein CI109_003733 [Kwoniella shandongensis]
MGDRILVLDGGMGTTLETLGYDVNTPLWGSELLSSNPGAIEGIHERYLQSGADIIETATYQLTPSNLTQHLSCSSETAAQILRKGVNVAHSANGKGRAKGKIALSFGPFGSTLSPGQEYGGIYPPPYGPSTSTNAFPSPSNLTGDSSTAAGAITQEEEVAVEALAQFHLDKLRVFASDLETWKQVDWIAFETVPVLHEVKAIRRAMGVLNVELAKEYAGDDHWWEKKFWITSPFPSGQHPQLIKNGQDHASIQQVLSAFIEGDGAIPHGIGINCANPSYLPSLTEAFTSAFRATAALEHERRPYFVLYPDGGQVYDTITRTWSTPPSSGGPEAWAKQVYTIAKDLESATTRNGEKLWGGVIVGGCCKSSFEEIRALRNLVDAES